MSSAPTPRRAKTSATSTSGSFAPRTHGAPGEAAVLIPLVSIDTEPSRWPVGEVPDVPLHDLDEVIAGDVEYHLYGVGHVDGSGAHDADFALAHLDPALILDANRYELMCDTLRRDGAVREPLTIHVYPDGRAVLRDGHHRYFAARALAREGVIESVPVTFHHAVADPDEAYGWAFPTDEAW